LMRCWQVSIAAWSPRAMSIATRSGR
jgi:hypothetical protein